MLQKRAEAIAMRPMHAIAPAAVQLAGSAWLLRSGMPISLTLAVIATIGCAVSLLLVWVGPLGDTLKLMISGALLGLLMALVTQVDLFGLRRAELELAERGEGAAPSAGRGGSTAVHASIAPPNSSSYTHDVRLEGGGSVRVTGSQTAHLHGDRAVLQLRWFASRGNLRRYCGTTSAAAADEAAARTILDRLVEETVTSRRAGRNPCNQHRAPWR